MLVPPPEPVGLVVCLVVVLVVVGAAAVGAAAAGVGVAGGVAVVAKGACWTAGFSATVIGFVVLVAVVGVFL